MKKTLSLLLVLCLCLSLCFAFSGCNDDTPPANDSIQNNTGETNNHNSTPDAPPSSNEPSENDTSDTVQWRKFLADYEDWVDSYIVVVKKYTANPSDMSVLTEYTEMLTEMTEWSEQIEEVEAELENASPQELVEYSAELSRIALKLAEAAY